MCGERSDAVSPPCHPVSTCASFRSPITLYPVGVRVPPVWPLARRVRHGRECGMPVPTRARETRSSCRRAGRSSRADWPKSSNPASRPSTSPGTATSSPIFGICPQGGQRRHSAPGARVMPRRSAWKAASSWWPRRLAWSRRFTSLSSIPSSRFTTASSWPSRSGGTGAVPPRSRSAPWCWSCWPWPAVAPACPVGAGAPPGVPTAADAERLEWWQPFVESGEAGARHGHRRDCHLRASPVPPGAAADAGDGAGTGAALRLRRADDDHHRREHRAGVWHRRERRASIRFRTPVEDPKDINDPVPADGAGHVGRRRPVWRRRPRHPSLPCLCLYCSTTASVPSARAR